jgi:Zn-finger nucleic acid-binding protein
MDVERVHGASVLRCDKCPAVWVEDAERKALARKSERKHEPAEFLPGQEPPTIKCPSCEVGRLQAGRIDQRKVMCCGNCKGVLVSFNKGDPWPTVLEVVGNILCLF